jgi:hypothetical protein
MEHPPSANVLLRAQVVSSRLHGRRLFDAKRLDGNVALVEAAEFDKASACPSSAVQISVRFGRAPARMQRSSPGEPAPRPYSLSRVAFDFIPPNVGEQSASRRTAPACRPQPLGGRSVASPLHLSEGS